MMYTWHAENMMPCPSYQAKEDNTCSVCCTCCLPSPGSLGTASCFRRATCTSPSRHSRLLLPTPARSRPLVPSSAGACTRIPPSRGSPSHAHSRPPRSDAQGRQPLIALSDHATASDGSSASGCARESAARVVLVCLAAWAWHHVLRVPRVHRTRITPTCSCRFHHPT